jgi:hypothetical protein
MKSSHFFILIFFMKISSLFAYSCEFIKLENCSTSDNAIEIERCDLEGGKLNFIFTYKKTYKKGIVSLVILRKKLCCFL